jgi:hypothetical protein
MADEINTIDVFRDSIDVYELSTEAVQVVTQGPQGAQGATGPTGPAGSTTFGTTAGTSTEGNDARIATIGSGTINTTDGGGYINTAGGGSNGGFIDTQGGDDNGGNIDTSCRGTETGGNIYTYSEGNNIGAGGNILTYGGSSGDGGFLDLSNGGGSISTRGTGSIELGETGTRTTLVGSATTDKTVTLPNATGTVALTTMNSGSISASAPLFDLAQTWNNAAVAFTSLKLNVTATLAASNSLLADLQIGGSPVFSVARISSTAGNVGAWLYGTYSSAGANYERGFMRWSGAAGTFQIGTEKLGTGGARAMEFHTDNTLRAQVTSAGNFWVNNQLILGTTVMARLTAPSDGVVTLFDAGQTTFGRLQFGGTTSSFPALKRSSTVLQARLANDGDFCPLQGQLRIHQNAVAETPTATHTMTLYDAAGTAYKVLCVAA